MLCTKSIKTTKPATCVLICGEDFRISGKQQTMLDEERMDYINVFSLLR